MLDRANPMASAVAFARRAAVDGDPGIVTVGGETYRWQGGFWEVFPEDAVRAELWLWTSRECVDAEGNPFKPTGARVQDIAAALAALSRHDVDATSAWLRSMPGDADPADLIVCQNGILNARTRRMMAPTARLFAVNVLPIDADPLAPAPEAWLAFLDQLFGGDREALELLQEWVALSALTRDTSHQKALLIIGPKRSGKGTVLRILRALAGATNVCSPTFSSLGTPFGLQPLIGKLVALLSDARLSSRTDLAVLAEVILRVTGEDAVTVPRKFQTDWTGTLPVRFTVVSNELPNLADASGALASRFLVLRLTRSFYGAEDHTLTDRLLVELPGILNWALDGLDRLRKRGHLVQPHSGQELVDELEALASPITMFARDCCVLDPAAEGAISALYERWLEWCRENGRDHPGTVASFGKQLCAAFPELRKTQPRRQGRQVRCYAGIRPRTGMDLETADGLDLAF